MPRGLVNIDSIEFALSLPLKIYMFFWQHEPSYRIPTKILFFMHSDDNSIVGVRGSPERDISSLRAFGPGGGQVLRVVQSPARALLGLFREK